MLARCPECQVTHAIARGDTLRLQRVRCDNCGAEFDLFPSLEIGGAGAPVRGRGLTPARHRPAVRIDTPRQEAVPLNIEAAPDATTLAAPAAARRAPALALTAALLALLALQLLLVPPIAPDEHNTLDQARGELCARIPCPAWHPLRAPERIRTSTPDFFAAADGSLHLQFSLESPVQQAWPVLDIHLSDRLGTALGRLRLTPDDYADAGSLLAANRDTPVRVTLANPPAPVAGVDIRTR
ncbi:DUF3426 domain-containing protein [Thioalkalivibrio sp. ALJ16]|uniref:DUF3426 domain-containing protein n=1 Tax=Thioalkalivibrio sp. ALJ16 TaxID=1158762 RepID=UPI0003745A5D|nr:DUF3426 domain-containing protein [Thioalkalivibrio sp. ALJ16]